MDKKSKRRIKRGVNFNDDILATDWEEVTR